MTEEEITTQYSRDELKLKAWGDFIRRTLIPQLKEKFGDNYTTDVQCFRQPRLKTIDSLIEKALYRGKNYSDPYADVKDKVGLRIVTLLSSHVGTISSIVESNENKWDFRIDRDFESDKLNKPEYFDYQSKHYILTSNEDVSKGQSQVEPGLPCELQIRTLLQHAFSEISHSRFYKPTIEIPAELKRHAAKAIALTEVTDDKFQDMNDSIQRIINEQSPWARELQQLYQQLLARDSKYETKLNTTIIELNHKISPDLSIETLRDFYATNHGELYLSVFKANMDRTIYRQPSVLLIYYNISCCKDSLRNNWPLSKDLLNMLFTKAGVNPDINSG